MIQYHWYGPIIKLPAKNILLLSMFLANIYYICNIFLSSPSPNSRSLLVKDDHLDEIHRNIYFNKSIAPINRLLKQSTEHALSSGGWVQLGDEIIGEERNDYFGSSLAISENGSFIVVGAPYNDGNGRNSGRARILKYHEDDKRWVHVEEAIDGESADLAGSSLDINDDGSVVAISFPRQIGTDVRVRIYRNIDGQWVQQGQDLEGHGVALSHNGRRVVVRGPSHSVCTSWWCHPGYVIVYEYTKDGQKWVQVGGNIDAGEALDNTGVSMDINGAGDFIIIGDPSSDYGGSKNGYARVYRNIDGEWVQQGEDLREEGEKIANEFGYINADAFGFSVAISSNGLRVIVGDPMNDNANGKYSGNAKVYEYVEDIHRWMQVGGDINGKDADDQSGWSVDMSGDGDVVIVGAPYSDNGSRINAGHARIYRNVYEEWVQQGQDLDGERRSDHFGQSAAISHDGMRVVIGGPGYNSDSGNDSGHVRVFEFDETFKPSFTPNMTLVLIITIIAAMIIAIILYLLRTKITKFCMSKNNQSARRGLGGATSGAAIGEVPVAQEIEHFDDDTGTPVAQVVGSHRTNVTPVTPTAPGEFPLVEPSAPPSPL